MSSFFVPDTDIARFERSGCGNNDPFEEGEGLLAAGMIFTPFPYHFLPIWLLTGSWLEILMK